VTRAAQRRRRKYGRQSSDRAFTVSVLSAGDGAERFHQGIRGSLQAARRRVAGGRECERFPDGISYVLECGIGELVEIETEVPLEEQPLLQAADQDGAVAS
jgi:hypothetical protein